MTTITIVSRIASHVSVFAKSGEAIAKAQAEVGRKAKDQLLQLSKVWTGAETMNGAKFDADCKDALRAELSKVCKDEKSVNALYHRHKMVILGLVNGVAITDETPNATTYAKVAGEALKAKGLYVPKTGSNGGRKAAPKAAAVKDGTHEVVVSRDIALAMLCGNDKARMQSLDAALTEHADKFWQAVNAIIIAGTKKA
jgi:hypothetical protein